MWNRERVHESFRRSHLLIAYLILVTGAVIAFMYMSAITDRIELEGQQRAYENCQSSNETRQIIAAILDRLAVARDDDAPGEFETRQRLRTDLDEVLQGQECPPNPQDAEFEN